MSTIETNKRIAAAGAYTAEALLDVGKCLLSGLARCASLEQARTALLRRVERVYSRAFARGDQPTDRLIRGRDCALALRNVLEARSDELSGFSVAQALWDIARGRRRDDLQAGFFAEIIHWVRGLRGRSPIRLLSHSHDLGDLSGRQAALVRSDDLDRLWQAAEAWMQRYPDGLMEHVQARRRARKQFVLQALGGDERQWQDWKWQAAHLMTDADALARAVRLTEQERANIARARAGRLPFAVTPYYASLMDDTGRDDRAVRAQVIPPADYVEHMLRRREDRRQACDFMLEADTSPVDLVTRRYPAIAILKPYNSCPQICVYCQRNWELRQALAPDAMATQEQLRAAVEWFRAHPAVREVLITGGDPLMMDDAALERLLSDLAAIPHIDLIRIGTRMIVTMPMRITQALADMLGGFRRLGRRDVAVVTHVEHPYEVTPDLAAAVDRLRRAGMGVYNQQVYTFYVSRRFESAMLRMLIRRVGIDPYYTFAPKGKEETASYRIPLARILQERKEEARLLPGLRRTDEPVYNLPGLGKNYILAGQHHDILSVLPDGCRVYEFHPWEKNIAEMHSCLAVDVPVLDYLRRLEQIGEDPADYDSIWYYF